MAELKKYKVYCSTEGVYHETDFKIDAPTTCPVNNTHTIDTAQTKILEVIADNEVTIHTEDVPTGGHTDVNSIEVYIPATIGLHYKNIQIPMGINLIRGKWFNELAFKEDDVQFHVAPDTLIGGVALTVTANTAWVDQDYVVGDTVRYTDGMSYECVVDTGTDHRHPKIQSGPDIEVIDIMYWECKHPEFLMSPGVPEALDIGYFVNIGNQDLGRVITIDRVNNKITTEFSPATTINPGSLIYMTIKIVSHMHLSGTETMMTLEGGIDSQYMPSHTVLRIVYNNVNGTAKTYSAIVEYFY